jgi:hypothetical protein
MQAMGFDHRFKLGNLELYTVKISNSNLTVRKYISEMSIEHAHSVFLKAHVVLYLRSKPEFNFFTT